MSSNLVNLVTDQTFHWTGFGNGFGNWVSHCRLRILDSTAGPAIVVVSDQELDTGTSITNCAAPLASLVVQQFNLDPNHLVWIEHYPHPDNECSRVTFTWNGDTARRAHWAHLPIHQAEAITGFKL